jgi:acetyl esterase/lipase
MSRFRLLPSIVLVLALPACTITQLFNAIIPTGDLTKSADISYGVIPRQKLDIYTPKSATAAPKPVIVFFYGGSWDSGGRDEYLFVAEALTSRGFIAVVPDYRLYPDVKFPDFIDDAAQAFVWTKTHISRYGGDANRIYVMGHSAGAHLAAMLTYDQTFLARAGGSYRDISGMIGLAGPYDFLPLKSERLMTIFGPVEGRPRSQPINFVDGDEPPALLLHGDNDTIVGPHNSANLARRIREKGGKVEHIRYPDMEHRAMVVSISAPLRSGKPVLDQIERFIRNGKALDSATLASGQAN